MKTDADDPGKVIVYILVGFCLMAVLYLITGGDSQNTKHPNKESTITKWNIVFCMVRLRRNTQIRVPARILLNVKRTCGRRTAGSGLTRRVAPGRSKRSHVQMHLLVCKTLPRTRIQKRTTHSEHLFRFDRVDCVCNRPSGPSRRYRINLF